MTQPAEYLQSFGLPNWDVKLNANLDALWDGLSALLPSATYISPASIDPGHRHSLLYEPDGTAAVITADNNGKIGIGKAPSEYMVDVLGGVNAAGLTINGIPVGTSTDTYWSAISGGISYGSKVQLPTLEPLGAAGAITIPVGGLAVGGYVGAGYFRPDAGIEINRAYSGGNGALFSIFDATVATVDTESAIAMGAYDGASVMKKLSSISTKWAVLDPTTGHGVLRLNVTYGNYSTGAENDIGIRIFGGDGVAFHCDDDVHGPGPDRVSVNGGLMVGTGLGVTGPVWNGGAYPSTTDRVQILDGYTSFRDTICDHKMTTVSLVPDAVGILRKANSGTRGGFEVLGLSAEDYSALKLKGVIGSNTPAEPAILIQGGKYDGGTNWTACAAAEKVLSIFSYATEIFTVLGGGNVGINTFTFGTSAAKVLGIGSGTAPTTGPANVGQLWVEDINAAAGYAGLHKMTETTAQKEVVPGVIIKASTGSPANPYEGLIEINAFDNKINMYADAAWRQLATW